MEKEEHSLISGEKKNSFGTNTLIIADKDFPISKKILSKFESIKFLKYRNPYRK